MVCRIAPKEDEGADVTFTPIDLMLQRAVKFGADSDAALFNELLYVGEFIVKMTTAAIVAGIQDDREVHRYRLMHGLSSGRRHRRMG
jgi:hypothetical protein